MKDRIHNAVCYSAGPLFGYVAGGIFGIILAITLPLMVWWALQEPTEEEETA